MVWVTSCGCQEPPAKLQIGFGFLASVTSATIGRVEPDITSTASLAAAVPVQLGRSAAHEGTATGLGSGLGEGKGLGVGLGLGLGLGVGEWEGAGLATRGPLAVQPAMATRAHTRTTPFLTAGETNVDAAGLRVIFWGKAVQDTR